MRYLIPTSFFNKVSQYNIREKARSALKDVSPAMTETQPWTQSLYELTPKYKIYTVPQRLYWFDDHEAVFSCITKKLLKGADKVFQKNYEMLENDFKDLPARFSGRLKLSSSIMPKLKRRLNYLYQSATPLFENAKHAIPDLYGYKLILNNGSSQESAKVHQKLISLIKDKKLMPSHALVHGNRPYFDSMQCQELENLGMTMKYVNSPSGFAGTNMYFYTKTGEKIEIQLTGSKVNAVNRKEHLWYNYNTKKQALEDGKLMSDYQKVFEKLTKPEQKAYTDYTKKSYDYARLTEQGEFAVKPEFPSGLDKLLELNQ